MSHASSAVGLAVKVDDLPKILVGWATMQLAQIIIDTLLGHRPAIDLLLEVTDREIEFYEFFSFLKFNEFYEFFFG